MSAPTLAQQQHAFRQAIVAEEPVPTDALFVSGAVDAAKRVAIYRHAYRARLVDALAANYPMLARALGDEAFDELAQAYLAAHPSRRPSIRWFGDALAEFAERHEALGHPALVDLARLEWAICAAFDAADRAPMTREALAARSPEAWAALALRAHPSVTLLQLDWAVEPVWQALSRDDETGEETELPEPEPHAHALVVWREHLAPKWRSLDEPEAAAVRALYAGTDFGSICELAAEHDPANPAALALGWLTRWLDDGLVCSGDIS